MTASVRDRLVAILFVAALIVPGVLLAAGIRPDNIENRLLARAPVVELDRLLDPKLYAAIDRYLGDNFPLRTVAVAARARIDYQVLGGSTNSEVVVGRDGWLFPADEFEPVCRIDAAGLLGGLDAVSRAFREAGRPIRLVIAPDKRSIYPDAVKPGLPYPSACTETDRSALRAGFAARSAMATDLWGPVLARRVAAGGAGDADGAGRAAGSEPIYWQTDTHWNDVGALAAVRALVEAELPGVWDPEAIRIDGTSPRVGDLSRLIGLPTTERTARVVIDRGGTMTRRELDAGLRTTPGRELFEYEVSGVAAGTVVPGRTLIVYDSSFGVHADLIAPWFADSVWLHVNELIDHPLIVDALPDYDRIIVERVERLAYTRDLATTLAPLLR